MIYILVHRDKYILSFSPLSRKIASAILCNLDFDRVHVNQTLPPIYLKSFVEGRALITCIYVVLHISQYHQIKWNISVICAQCS